MILEGKSHRVEHSKIVLLSWQKCTNVNPKNKTKQQSYAMTLLITSLIRKTTLFLAAATLSVSAMASDFNQVQREANQGNAIAQAMFGVMYDLSKGVPQDYTKAAVWYEKAANQGLAKSQYNLGVMYANGEGVRQNTATAKEWFGKACDNGNQGGCDTYRKLNQR